MGDWIQLVGPNRAVQVFGVKLVGVNAANGNKVLFSLAFILLVILLGRTFKVLARVLLRGPPQRESRVLDEAGHPAWRRGAAEPGLGLRLVR